MAASPLDSRTIDRLDAAIEVDAQTPRRDGSTSSRPIWVVVSDGDAYVRSYRGASGAWYRRAYDYDGNPVGSSGNEEGQIFIEPQGMAAMAGLGLANGRAATALASVRERLATPHGILLVQPAFTRYHVELGEITSYPPGYKENGAVFCHTNPWLMIGEAITGNADGAKNQLSIA